MRSKKSGVIKWTLETGPWKAVEQVLILAEESEETQWREGSHTHKCSNMVFYGHQLLTLLTHGFC